MRRDELGSDSGQGETNKPTCPECGAHGCQRDGHTRDGKQRYRCPRIRDCGRRFILDTNRPKRSSNTRKEAIRLWILDHPVTEIAIVLCVHRSTIYRWIRDWLKRRRERQKG